MTKMLQLTLSGLLALSVAACALPGGGKKIETSMLESFTPGVTTCSQIMATLGQPASTFTGMGQRRLGYYSSKGIVAWQNLGTQNVVIVCDGATDKYIGKQVMESDASGTRASF